VRGVDDGADGLSEAAFDRAAGLRADRKARRGKGLRSTSSIEADARLEALKDDWRAGRGGICAGTVSHAEQEPERDHFDVYMDRDGELRAYACSMDLYRKYVVTYGKPAGRWCYEVPDGITAVY
jgi:hypothetical protein